MSKIEINKEFLERISRFAYNVTSNEGEITPYRTPDIFDDAKYLAEQYATAVNVDHSGWNTGGWPYDQNGGDRPRLVMKDWYGSIEEITESGKCGACAACAICLADGPIPDAEVGFLVAVVSLTDRLGNSHW